MATLRDRSKEPAALLRLPNDTAAELDRLMVEMGPIVGRNRAAVIHALACAHPTGASALGCLARAMTPGPAGDLQGIHDKALERIRAAHEVEHAAVVRAHEAALEAERAGRDLAVRAAVDRGRLGGFNDARLGISHEAAAVLVRAWPGHAADVLRRHGIRVVVDDDPDSDEVGFERL
jgi:hypothetical protein